jgi:hypothetical protein
LQDGVGDAWTESAPVHVLSEIVLVHMLTNRWVICAARCECGKRTVPQRHVNGGYRILYICRT